MAHYPIQLHFLITSDQKPLFITRYTHINHKLIQWKHIKPLGKTLKIGNPRNKTPKLHWTTFSYVTAPQLIQQYVQNQQSGYFGVPYHQDFSRINEDTAIRSQNAAEKDSGQCLNWQNLMNSSPKPITFAYKVGGTVIVKNHLNKQKFDPFLRPIPHQIISKCETHGVTLPPL